MTDRLYTPDGSTILDGKRPGKRYFHAGVDPDGANRIVEMSEEAQAEREADEARPTPKPPARRDLAAEIDALETRVKALERA